MPPAPRLTPSQMSCASKLKLKLRHAAPELEAGSDMISHGALCLETQFYPDSVHHENFPFRYVTPEKPFESKTIYKFTVK